MKISYKKLWFLCVEKEMSKATLRKRTGISSGTLTKLRKSEPVAVEILMRICTVLQCNIGDIMDFVPDDSKEDAE